MFQELRFRLDFSLFILSILASRWCVLEKLMQFQTILNNFEQLNAGPTQIGHNFREERGSLTEMIIRKI